MNRIVIVLLTLFVLGFSVTASAQDKVGFYPYIAFESKPLPVGTTVWANIGEGECSFGNTLPIAADRCFETGKLGEYRRGKIVKHERLNNLAGERRWTYRIQFEGLRTTDSRPVEWNGRFDDAFTACNLPEKWAKHSKYFILLYW